MLVSTRNQLSGCISSVRRGSVNAEVQVELAEGLSIVSVITIGSVERLGLDVGKPVIALIKASSVILGLSCKVNTSARNQLCGRVSHYLEGSVNAEVCIELAEGVTITAIITNGSANKLGISVGSEVCALVKSSSVIVAVPYEGG